MGALTKIGSQVALAERTLIAGSDIALLSGADVAEEAHAAVTDAIREGRFPGTRCWHRFGGYSRTRASRVNASMPSPGSPR